MTQDDGWRLMMIGRRLERLQFLCDVLALRLAADDTPLRQELEWLLDLGDSAITYRTRYRAPPVWDNTIELLVYDEHNPRALAFQWRSVNTLLIEVAESLGTRPQDALYEPIEDLIALRENPPGDDPLMVQASHRILSQCLKELNAAAAQVSDQLTSQHFSHVDFELQGGDRMTQYAVRHTTVYEYGGEVAHSHHLLHLTPREFEYQRCLAHSLRPGPASRARRARIGMPSAMPSRGSNTTARTTICPSPPKCGSRCCRATSAASSEARAGSAVRERLRYHASAPRRRRPRSVSIPNAIQPRAHEGRGPGLRERVPRGRPADLPPPRTRSRDKIYREFEYVPGSTTNRTSIIEVLESRRGVCQDFAHLMIGCLRSSGLAARYVSGYIRTVRAAEPEALVGGDASHAWVSVYCPPLGWVDFDPTNDCVVGEDHVTLAWGRDFGDVSPLRGMIVGRRPPQARRGRGSPADRLTVGRSVRGRVSAQGG